MINLIKQKPHSGTIRLILLFWAWTIPATYFWNLCVQHDIVLPHLTRSFWILPGSLWQLFPLLNVICIIVFSATLYVLSFKKETSARILRSAFLVIFIIGVVVNIIWGNAVNNAV